MKKYTQFMEQITVADIAKLAAKKQTPKEQLDKLADAADERNRVANQKRPIPRKC